jgi:hypothetical protein
MSNLRAYYEGAETMCSRQSGWWFLCVGVSHSRTPASQANAMNRDSPLCRPIVPRFENNAIEKCCDSIVVLLDVLRKQRT